MFEIYDTKTGEIFECEVRATHSWGFSCHRENGKLVIDEGASPHVTQELAEMIFPQWIVDLMPEGK